MKSRKSTKRSLAHQLDPLDGDLSDLISSGGWTSIQFELTEKKNKTLSLRLSEKLLTELQKQAQASGLDMQKYIRLILEKSVRRKAG